MNVNRYERDRRARRRCVQVWGHRCDICGFDFAEKYGPTMEGVIHVHHLRPVSSLGDDYHIDPVRDMRPVCPNCHAVLHRREPPYSIEEVKELIRVATTKVSDTEGVEP